MSAADRFWAKVNKHGPIPTSRPELGPCWIWTAAHNEEHGGYGRFKIGGVLVQAHRWSYEERFGAITEGLTIDHLCMVTLCVNSGHLEAVTMQMNILRGNSLSARRARMTHCRIGHPLVARRGGSASNQGDRRFCRECDQARRNVATPAWAQTIREAFPAAFANGKPAFGDLDAETLTALAARVRADVGAQPEMAI